MYTNNSRGAKSKLFILLTKAFSGKLENNFHVFTCSEYDEARYDVNGNRAMATGQWQHGN
jgi:hypothetical protein